MALYGPNSETSLVAEDDDGGAGRNSMITAQLEPGEYYVQVRHYSEEGSGPYRILVGR